MAVGVLWQRYARASQTVLIYHNLHQAYKPLLFCVGWGILLVTVGEIVAPDFSNDGHCWRIRGPSVGLTQPITLRGDREVSP